MQEAEEKKELKTGKFSDKSRSKPAEAAAKATPPQTKLEGSLLGAEGGFTISITGNLFVEYRKLSNSAGGLNGDDFIRLPNFFEVRLGPAIFFITNCKRS